MRILIVDDNKQDLYLLQKVLESRDYHVETAVNGGEALEKARQSPPDMIISDILMPVMDGFHLCREVKKDDKLKNILFVFYTATYTDKRDEELALGLGAAKFIIKPQEPEVFIDMIGEAISEHEKGKAVAPKKPVEEETVFFKEYNEALIRKLEKKMLDLEKSEKKYSTIAEKGNDGIIIIQDGLLKFVNPKMAEITGFSMEEGVGKPFIDFVSPEYRELVMELYKKRASGEEVQDRYEIEILSKDGGKIPVEINATIIEYEDRPADMAIIRDITERKKAEKALIESEGKYRSLMDDVLDNSDMGIFILDSDFKVVWVNRALERFFGVVRDDIIGKNKRKLIKKRIKYIFEKPDDFANTVLATYDNNTYVESFECHVIQDSERKERWLEHLSHPIEHGFYLGGRIELYYDITERKKTENEIQESREFLNRTIESSADAIITTNSEGLVTTWSNGAEDLFGYSVREVLGKPIHIMYPEEFKEVRRKWQREVSNGNTLKNIETLVYNKNGKLLDINLSLAPLNDKQGGIMGTVGVSRDITQFKRAEESLRFTQFATDHASDAIFWIGLDAQFVYVNKAACRRLGYTQDELLALSVYDIGPDWPPETWPDHWREIKKHGSRTFETRHQRKDGSIFPVEITANFLTFGGQEFNCAIVRDITDRKKAEEELERKMKELERFTKLAVGRELKMIELKKRIKTLEEKLESGGV